MNDVEIRRLLIVWVALLVLLALTLGSSYVPLHGFNTVTNVAIAFAKAALVATFYMHLRDADGVVRMVALIAFVWILILFALSLADFLFDSNLAAPHGKFG